MRLSKGDVRAIGVGLFAALCLVACGGGGGDDAVTPPTTPPPTEPVPTTPTPTATIAGKAVDGATGLGVGGVTVSAGTVATTTAADGSFTLAGVAPGGRVPVSFASPSYAESSRIANAVADATADVQVRLLAVGASSDVPVATGGTVTVPGSTAQVSLPANGVQRADGSAPTGNFTVRLTPINPAIDTALMPGDFMSSTTAGNVPIESFGALNVSLTDSAGVALNLRSGQTATIRIPLASRNGTVPPTIPLYYYNMATGLWQQEGTATLADTGAGAYYEGTVSHFSTWNADQVYNTVVVTGCLKDAAGALVANALVMSDGIDYSGTSSAYTNASGAFSLPIRSSSSATITGVFGGHLTNTVRNEPSASAITLPECLTLSQAGAGITMKLTWGALPDDLDSLLITPSGEEIYFGSKGALVTAPFANLDVDDTNSYGPEVVTITKLMVGTYKYSVNNYSGYSSGPIASSGARVEVNMPGRPVELITPPATAEAPSTQYWNLIEFDVSANCAITVRRVQTFTDTAPATPAGTAPQYCTP